MHDFLVIGGGIAGVSAAARLSDLGSVCLLEQEDSLGYHASGRSAALFEPNYGNHSTVALNRASAEYHATANGGVLSDRGVLLVGTATTETAFLSDMSTMEMTEISLTEALERCPILNTKVVQRTAFEDNAKDIDTDKLLQGFARHLRAQGGQILTKRQVSGIERQATGWQVRCGKETHSAHVLVNAAGAWADQIAVLAGLAPIGLRPLRRSVARVPAPEGLDVRAWPMIFGPGETWYAKPDAGALLVSPADETPCEPHDAFADDLTLAEGLARFEAHVHYDTPRLLASWAGLRTFSPDGSLVIGPASQDAGFLWCAAQGGYGMQSSPAASRLLADLAAGRQPEIGAAEVAALSPARFAK